MTIPGESEIPQAWSEETVNFYDVGGRLVRQWIPARRRKMLEVWNGDGWTPYPDLDEVLRHGVRITDIQALGLVRSARDRDESWTRLNDEEARAVLHARLRRA